MPLAQTTMTRKRMRSRSKAKAPHTTCRCLSNNNKPCTAFATDGSLFGSAHQQCAGSPMSGAEPSFNPKMYDKFAQTVHNCWAYGMGVFDPSQLTQCDGKGASCHTRFHQPGGTKGLSNILQEAKGRTCKTVDYLMRQDVPDLTPATFKEKCPIGKSKIAMVVHPGEDYHFYRQDSDGWWSHKDGGNTVKRFDAEGQPIWNPQTASRDYRPKGSFLNYNDFCGFYCAPRSHAIRLAQGGSRKTRRRRPL